MRRGWAAACSLLLLGGMVAGCTSDDGGDEARRRQEAELRKPNAEPGSGPTGWYLPRALPDSWALDEVELIGSPDLEPTDDPSDPCECSLDVWQSDQDGRPFVVARQAGATVDVVLSRYREGMVETEPTEIWREDGVIVRPSDGGAKDPWPMAMVVVSNGTEVLQVAGVEVDLKAIRQTAIDWASGFGTGPQPVEGESWTQVATGGHEDGVPSAGARLWWSTPDGRLVVDLVPTGTRPFLPARFSRPAEEGELSIVDAGSGGVVRYLPGAEARVPLIDDDSYGSSPSDELVKAALEPVSATAWASALEAVDHAPELVAPTLADVVEQVAAGGETVQIWSDLDEERVSSTDVDGLVATLEVTSTTATVGTPLGASLLLRNTTEAPIRLTECNDASKRWGLVPADEVTGSDIDADVLDRHLDSQNYIDCYPTIGTVIAPGATHRSSVGPALFTSEVSERNELGDPLPAGRYRLVAEVVGRWSKLVVIDPRVIELTDPPCPALPDGVDLEPGASTSLTSRVEGAGLRLELVRPGDDVGPTDCDRVLGYRIDGREPVPNFPAILIRG